MKMLSASRRSRWVRVIGTAICPLASNLSLAARKAEPRLHATAREGAMIKTLFLATAAAVLPLTAAAAAQAPQQPKPVNRTDYIKAVDAHFNQLDANHDGKVTKEELAAELQRELQMANTRIAQQLQAKFKQMDTNHDGQL